MKDGFEKGYDIGEIVEKLTENRVSSKVSKEILKHLQETGKFPELILLGTDISLKLIYENKLMRISEGDYNYHFKSIRIIPCSSIDKDAIICIADFDTELSKTIDKK